MIHYQEIEFDNVDLAFFPSQMHKFIETLTKMGMLNSVPLLNTSSWENNFQNSFSIVITDQRTSYKLDFLKENDMYKLQNTIFRIRETKLAFILLKFIRDMKGSAIVKLISSQQMIITTVDRGDFIRMIQIRDAKKMVLFDKHEDNLKKINEMVQTDDEKKYTSIEEIKSIIDEELLNLYEAMQKSDEKQIDIIREKLQTLYVELKNFG